MITKNDIFLLIYFISFCLSEDCDKLNPIRYNNSECQMILCSKEELENKICIISNEIVKIQWINKIITNSETNIFNLNAINHFNELIISAFDEDNNSIILYNLNINNDILNIKAIINNFSFLYLF